MSENLIIEGGSAYQLAKETYDKFYKVTKDKKKAKRCARIALQMHINTLRCNAYSLDFLIQAEQENKDAKEILKSF